MARSPEKLGPSPCGLTSVSQCIRVSLQAQAGQEHVKKKTQRASSLQEGSHLHGGRLIKSDGKCLGGTSPAVADYHPSSLTFQHRPSHLQTARSAFPPGFSQSSYSITTFTTQESREGNHISHLLKLAIVHETEQTLHLTAMNDLT